MVMTSEEIVRDYRLSKNPKEQIKILADRNQVTQDAIRAVLLDAGMEVPGKRKSPEKKRKAAWGQDRARELLAEGKAIREIADAVGASYYAVQTWIHRTGLPYNDARKRHTAAEEKLPEQETATVSAPLPAPEPPAEDNPEIYRQIESVLGSLPEGMGEKAGRAAGKLAV